jgi:hypothetical protein
MELAVAIETNPFDQGIRRTSIWRQQIASMSRRLEARWTATTPANAADPDAHELLGAYCIARATHDVARFDLASQD